jgi:hypothetical protein
MLRRWSLAAAFLAAIAPPVLAGPIETLQPGQWYRVPNSRLDAVYPNPWPPGNTGPPAVMNSWSSGAYDTKRDRLIVWGGGHWDYSGNEIYVFDVNLLRWQRLTNPTYDVSGTGPYYPNGTPRARHTYAYIEYVGGAFDRFCSFGGGSLYPGHNTNSTDCFNFDTLDWETYAPTPSFGLGAPAAYDPVRGKVWQHGSTPSQVKLSEFNPIANSVAIRGDYNNLIEYASGAVGVIDPVRRKFLILGNGLAVSWNIDDSGTLPMTNLKPLMTGATDILQTEGLGVAYDPVSDRIVAWRGGADVYVLDMNTLIWTRRVPAATNTVIPTAMDDNGTYGRFRYMPSKNAFIVVNATNQDVYFYKLSAGGGAPPDSIPPIKTTDLRPR